jgi:excisionase family DNA binding protein
MQYSEDDERRRIAELELEKARYEAQLAERRYAACDPDHRLIAAQLEESWEMTLRRVRTCEEKLGSEKSEELSPIDLASLEDLAEDLEAAWVAPSTSMRTRQRLVQTLIEDIVASIDQESQEIVLMIHWKGGRHTELRTRKLKSGEHGRRASEEADVVIRSMAGRWPDAHIAASLNRMRLRTGHGQAWSAQRVYSFRATHGIPGSRTTPKDGKFLTMSEAAQDLCVTNHVIRRLIRDGVLPAEQVVPGAPYKIRASDLRSDGVRHALAQRGRPCRVPPEDQNPLFPRT